MTTIHKKHHPKTDVLHKEFAQEWLSNGHNGTQAVLAIKNGSIKPMSAKTEATRLLHNPHVQALIEEALKEKGYNLGKVLSFHIRNLDQTEQLAVSQSAVGDMYQLMGLRDNNKTTRAVTFIVE